MCVGQTLNCALQRQSTYVRSWIWISAGLEMTLTSSEKQSTLLSFYILMRLLVENMCNWCRSIHDRSCQMVGKHEENVPPGSRSRPLPLWHAWGTFRHVDRHVAGNWFTVDSQVDRQVPPLQERALNVRMNFVFFPDVGVGCIRFPVPVVLKTDKLIFQPLLEHGRFIRPVGRTNERRICVDTGSILLTVSRKS